MLVVQRPRILKREAVARWLAQGLIVRITYSMNDEEERARTWLLEERPKPW